MGDKRKEISPLQAPTPKSLRLEGPRPQRNLLSFFRQPVAEPVPEPVAEPVPESVAEPSAEPVSEPVAGPSTDEPVAESVDDLEWPEVWTVQQISDNKAKYLWIAAKNKAIGCKACKAAKRLGLEANMGQSLAREWTEFTVRDYGATRTAKLSSLRKKISLHINSAAHEKAVKIMKQKGEDAMRIALSQQDSESTAVTERVLRTVYAMNKAGHAFSHLPDLIDLQKHNGAQLGVTLQSRFSARNITEVIAQEMRARIVAELIRVKSKITVLVDEATTSGKKSALIVDLTCTIDAERGPVFIFFDLIELESTKAADICAVLCSSLKKSGFTDEFLNENLEGFVSDGANVMLGRVNGVASLLKKKFPKLIVVHCLNHRLELAVGDTVSDVSAVFHFRSLMDKMYCVYSQSNKAIIELERCARELSVDVLRIGRVLSTRWVASSFNSVSAVWRNYEALHAHFCFASTDPTRKSSERAPFIGLKKRLEGAEFLHDLALMHDTLEELSTLSLQLQERSMNLLKAQRLMERSIRYIESLSSNPGPKFKEALHAIAVGSFRGIDISENRNGVKITVSQFLDKLSSNIKLRLMECSSEEQQLLEDMAIIDTDEWPQDVHLRFGEDEVKRLCNRFQLDVRQALQGLRDKNDGGSGIEMTALINAIRTIPCGTAECERNVSQMNLIATDLRSSLHIDIIGSVMMIRINGPPLTSWNPTPYVTAWRTSGHRAANDHRAKPRKSGVIDPQKAALFSIINK